MEETLKLILSKLDKLDKIDSDISALRTDNKEIHKKLDVITNELADIKEKVTDHDIKIQVINTKTKAI